MNPEAKPLSLRDLAKLAGVSASTVSLALNESPKLPEATIQRIKQFAKAHGYRRNPKLARILRATVNTRHKNTGEVIACLVTRKTRAQWDPANSQFLAMQARALEYGYTVEPFWFLEEGLSAERANRILRSRGIVGLLVLPPPHALRRDGRLTLPVEWKHFCAVEVDDTMTGPILPQVRHDHLSGITRALTELEALGYRRIGFALNTAIEFSTHHRWTAGYAYWNQMRGQGLVPLICPEFTPSVVRTWLDRHRPDVVLSPGAELLALIRSMGIAVPAGLGYASLDLLEGVPAETTGVNQEREVQAQLAVDLVVSLLNRNARGTSVKATCLTTTGSWRPGKTCVRRAGPELAPLETVVWRA
ncbi:MAG: LacI family DNA-binding transcriptional regulator [Verrucomicrobia bacterium]|nr:LacI family DNA-binding transcriptional regulator [Verrucomicrobiota bacterium]